MAGAKVVVLYPTPRDVNEFERVYAQDHVPMVTPDGSPPPFHRVAELRFPSMAALQEAAASPSAQAAVAHAFSISSGGTPVFLVAEEEISEF